MDKIFPVLVIHGGAGSRPPRGGLYEKRRASLESIVAAIYPRMERGLSSVQAVAAAVEMLEDDPLFNAGRGSKIQSDGKIRMSAAIMDGERRRFAGCVNVQGLKHPVRLAQKLLGRRDRVLDGQGASRFARAEGMAFASPYTSARREEFRRHCAGKSGTVGAVALDVRGRLSAATSTGGRGLEYPGRVSDTPTVAANFANRACALSATGVGEQIVEFGVAAAICTLVESGQPLTGAVRRFLAEAKRARAEFGVIALDGKGRYFADTTTAHLIWAAASRRAVEIHP